MLTNHRPLHLPRAVTHIVREVAVNLGMGVDIQHEVHFRDRLFPLGPILTCLHSVGAAATTPARAAGEVSEELIKGHRLDIRQVAEF